MRIESLKLVDYLSVRDEELSLGSLNVLIGANASGKSNLMDALRFLRDVVQHGFSSSVASRGGFIHLACKASRASNVRLAATFEHDHERFKWSILLSRQDFTYDILEEVHRLPVGEPPQQLLLSRNGTGWWWSGDEGRVELKERPGRCALAAAAADASFPARDVADFTRSWGFFDPNPGALRRASMVADASALAIYGQNLAARLHALEKTDRERFDLVHSATRDILGVPEKISFLTSEDDDRVALLFSERGLQYRIHQAGCSSGTLRMLAIMTALLGTPDATLIGIEEPENYIHPRALSAFTEHVLSPEGRGQLIFTTHSPYLLDVLDAPEAVLLVHRDDQLGTKVSRESHPDRVRRALDASGFGLGEWHETKGFGG